MSCCFNIGLYWSFYNGVNEGGMVNDF
jgi:hypothetical protein